MATSKILRIIVLLTVLGSILFIFFIIAKNTSILNRPNEQEITLNNRNLNQTEGQDQFSILQPKTLIVPKKFKNDNLENRTLYIPEQFEISVFAAGMKGPRSLALDTNNNIYVTDKNAGELIFISDSNADGIADDIKTIDSNLRSVHGIEYYNGNLYVGEEHQIVVYRNIDIKGNYSTKEVIIAGLPSGNIFSEGGGHKTRTVRIGPDQKLYVSIGSSCNVCIEDDPRRAAIVRYNLDGSGEEIFATGLRNTVGFIFNDQMIWGVDNGRDLIGDDLPPEEVNIIRTGGDYGWPYCYGNGISNPEYPDKAEFCEKSTNYPKYNLQAHSAPLGLNFAPWKGMEDSLLIAYHGSWNRTVPTGYKVVRIDTSENSPEPINFITGWLQDDGEVWGRPVDVIPYKGNSLLITDDKAGVVYIVSEK